MARELGRHSNRVDAHCGPLVDRNQGGNGRRRVRGGRARIVGDRQRSAVDTPLARMRLAGARLGLRKTYCANQNGAQGLNHPGLRERHYWARSQNQVYFNPHPARRPSAPQPRSGRAKIARRHPATQRAHPLVGAGLLALGWGRLAKLVRVRALTCVPLVCMGRHCSSRKESRAEPAIRPATWTRAVAPGRCGPGRRTPGPAPRRGRCPPGA